MFEAQFFVFGLLSSAKIVKPSKISTPKVLKHFFVAMSKEIEIHKHYRKTKQKM